MKKRLTREIISLLFIFLFVYAGFAKLLDIQKFQVEIGQSPVLTGIAPFVAWFIPLSEVTVALLLVTRKYRTIGFFGSFALMVLFTGYIISILQFSEHIPCSCGGILDSLGWTEHLIFNVVFVVLAGVGIFLSEEPAKRTGSTTLQARGHEA